MKRTHLARTSILELKKQIHRARQRKDHLLDYIEELKNAYNRKEISRARYHELIYSKEHGKTLHELIHEYDEFIHAAHKEIRKHHLHLHKGKALTNFFISIAVISIIFFAFYFGTSLTGFFLNVPQVYDFSQKINLQFNESTTYTWTPENKGTLTYLKLDGSILGKGSVKIYLDDLLILDSSKIKEQSSNSLLTGAAIALSDIENNSNITNSEELNLTEAQKNVSNETTNVSPIQNEPQSSENKSEFEINESSNTPPKKDETEEEIKKEIIKKFSDSCEDSCELGTLEINKEFYELKIVVENALLNLEEIKYGLTDVNVAEINQTLGYNETTTQFRAKINETVKWKKEIHLENKGPIDIDLPKDSTEIKVNKNSNEKAKFKLDKEKVTIDDNEQDYEIEYVTPAPKVIEEKIKNGKRIKISSQDDIHYENILAFTNIDESLKIKNPSSIKVYWVEEKSFIDPTRVEDLDGNGIYDYIEWTIPHLSNQTFEIIVITKAQHLDKNREFISDIYNEVKSQDDLWSETIPNKDYVRVTFEIPLDKTKDITLFPRIISGNPKVEIYEVNQTTKIAEFSNLNSNQYNKILLTNLQNSQDTFDLLVTGGSVEFDHIIDPSTPWVIYNFSGITSPSSSYTARNGSQAGQSIFAAGTEVTTAGYTALNSYNAVTQKIISSGSNAEPWQRFNFTLTQSRASIQWINVTITGNDSATENAVAYLWNDTGAALVTIGTFTASNANYTLNISGANVPNFINSTYNNVIIYVEGPNFDAADGDTIQVDFVKLDIQYTDNSPRWGNNASNDTLAGASVLHSINWTDDFGLSGYFFSFDNGTGTFVNDSFVAFSGTQSWSNVSKFVNNTAGSTIQWRIWANDSSGTWNVTNVFSYITTAANTAPKWRSASVDDSTPDPGQTVSHNINWTDDAALSYVILEVNSTGASCNTLLNVTTNSTFAGTTNWSNLTWAVPNECEGKTIGWRQYANDSANLWNVTTLQTYTVNNVNPNVSFGINPPNNQNSSSSSVTFDLKVADNLGVSYLNLYGNWSGSWIVNQTNSSPINNSYWNVTVTGIPDGRYVWAAWGNDTINNQAFSTANRTITIDTVAPTVNLYSYTNGTQKTNTQTLTLNISVTDATTSPSTCNIEVNGTNTTILVSNGWCNTTTIPLTNLGTGNRTINIYANDSANNLGLNNSFVVDIINSAPTVSVVNTISAQSPTESSTKAVTFNFTATDTDGASNINLSTAAAYFQKSGDTTRSNSSCINSSIGVGNNINFTCTISLWYFDGSGSWTINATIKDNSAVYAENSSTTFTYNVLTAMVISPGSLSWGTIYSNTTDTGSNNDPILINNTGNDDALDLNVTAYDLRGETTITQFIYAANFTVENASQGCSGTAMVNASSRNITSSQLLRGNNSLNYNNATSGQEELYFCLKGVPPELSQQSYSSSAYGPWQIIVSLALLIPRRKRKIKEDSLIKTLQMLLEDIKENYTASKDEAIKSIIKVIREKYRITRKETLDLIKTKEILIPSTIFKKDLGALETLTKYLKENLSMNYAEIANLLNRDERTIWASYSKANKKHPSQLETEKTDLTIPISIFENKELTVLESIIKYLKEKEMKFSEISKLLKRDQRNIWLIHSRLIKK